MLSLTFWTSTTLFSMTIMNPMLSDIYGIEPEKSSLLFTLSGVAFLCSTPIAFALRSRKLAKRRAIIFFAQIVMGVACILRTGNLLGEMNLWLVYISQILNGFAMALLTTTSFPEIVDNAEKSEFYHLYNKEAI
jgi:predicted MFS family arabinose efflux permease